METFNETPFAAGGLFTRSSSGEANLTVIVKGTFTLAQGETATIAAAQKPLCGDQVSGEGADRVCRYEDDFAPFKPCADLLLVGHGDRGEPAAGTCRVGKQGAALANFGPVSRNTGTRAELAGASGADWFSYHWPRLAVDAPWAYFNAAPPEMQTEGYLEGDEEIALKHLHPRHGSFHARLPGLWIRAFLRDRGGAVGEVPMKLDTLWVDLDTQILVLVWRGRTAAEPSELEDAGQILIVSEPLDQAKSAATYEARLAGYAAQDDSAKNRAEAPDSTAEMEGAMAEAGLDPAALPSELSAFMKNPGVGSEGLAAISGLTGSVPDSDGEAGGAAALAAAGIPVSDAPPVAADPENAIKEPSFAAQAGLDESQMATLTAQEEQGLADLPNELKAFMENPASGNSGLIELFKSDDSPVARMLAAEASTLAPALAPPSAQDLEKAMQAVPYWPPQDTDEAAAIETLTASFGADRPLRGDGTSFLALLTAIAGETAEPHDATQES